MTAPEKDYSKKIRVYVLYSGRVQGIGFRFTAQRHANEAGVRGYVRNLDNGRVELVAEGNKDKVIFFLGRLKSTLAHYIDKAEVNFTPYREEFTGFNIRL
jgi:acylphosphatase